RGGLAVTRVTVALLELLARSTRAGGVAAHLGEVDPVGRGGPLLGGAVLAGRGVVELPGALGPGQPRRGEGGRHGGVDGAVGRAGLGALGSTGRPGGTGGPGLSGRLSGLGAVGEEAHR